MELPYLAEILRSKRQSRVCRSMSLSESNLAGRKWRPSPLFTLCPDLLRCHGHRLLSSDGSLQVSPGPACINVGIVGKGNSPATARPTSQPQPLQLLFVLYCRGSCEMLRASNESGFLISTSTMNCCCGQWNFVKPTLQPSLRKHNPFSQGTDRGHPSRRRPRRSRVFLSSYQKHSNSRFSHADYSGVLHYLRLPD
jgi:hypothetical protein